MSDQVVKKSGQRPKVVSQSGQNVEVRKTGSKIHGLTQINGYYYYRPAQKKGVRPPRVALHTTSFEEAVQLALNLNRVAQGVYKPGLLSFEITRFFEARRTNQTIRRWSRQNDRVVLGLFLRWHGDGNVALITPAKLESWRDDMLARGLSSASVKSYLTRLGIFFNWLLEQGGLSRSPAKSVKKPISKKTKVDRFCTKPERERLFAMCEREDVRLILLLGFHCGLRLNEIVQARTNWLRFWSDADGVQHGEIVVQETDSFIPKDREARAVPMNTLVMDYFRGRETDQETFLLRPEVKQGKDSYRWNPRRPYKILCEKAGLAWVGFHTMRHTYATHLVMAGVPIASIARWLGDGIEVTYRHYAGYQPNRAHIDAGL